VGKKWGILLAMAPKSAWFHLLSASAIGNNSANGVKGSNGGDESGESWEWGKKIESCCPWANLVQKHPPKMQSPTPCPDLHLSGMCRNNLGGFNHSMSIPHYHWAGHPKLEWRKTIIIDASVCVIDSMHGWHSYHIFVSIGALMSSTKIPCG
jgi:hypothetical protein